MTGWRGLGVFWLAAVLVMGTCGVTLQVLGPPETVPPTPPRRMAAVPPTPAKRPVAEARPVASPAVHPGRGTPGPIADPDPALLEPVSAGSADMLPRVASDGRQPMQVYAAGFDRSSLRLRIGVIVAGIGLNEADSVRAVHDLPGGVTLAVSPYASTNLGRLLGAARAAEHEYLLSVPMEPQSFPLNDPGPRALMTGVTLEENLKRLKAVMALASGYVGVTGALGDIRGERFAGMTEQMDPVLVEIAKRALLYVDARPAVSAALPHVWSRDVDVVIDQPAEDIDARLADLERIAHDKGSALGLAGAPRPVIVQRLAAWANGLTDRGFILAPVSALVVPPADVEAAK